MFREEGRIAELTEQPMTVAGIPEAAVSERAATVLVIMGHVEEIDREKREVQEWERRIRHRHDSSCSKKNVSKRLLGVLDSGHAFGSGQKIGSAEDGVLRASSSPISSMLASARWLLTDALMH